MRGKPVMRMFRVEYYLSILALALSDMGNDFAFAWAQKHYALLTVTLYIQQATGRIMRYHRYQARICPLDSTNED
jgi:hypothetical protein